MKKYTKPEIEITDFSVTTTIAADILTASNMPSVTSFTNDVFVDRDF